MTTPREDLATSFAIARAGGLIDVKFFALIGEGDTPDSLRRAATKIEQAVLEGQVDDFIVADAGKVATSLEHLLY